MIEKAQRYATPMTDNVAKIEKGGRFYFVKTSSKREAYGTIQELDGYRRIEDYLNIPRVRRLSPSSDTLIIESAGERCFSKLIYSDFNTFSTGMENYLYDTINMWENSISDSNVVEIEKDGIAEAYSTLNSLNEFKNREAVLNSTLVINGKTSPFNTNELINRLQKFEQVSEYAVIAHGDEHLGNIFLRGKDSYTTIDPRFAGYHYISSVSNRIIGTLLIFMLKYEVFVSYDNRETIEIKWGLKGKCDLNSILSILRPIIDKTSELTKNKNNLKLQLCTNLLRAYFLMIDRKNLFQVAPHKYAYLALAHHLFNNDIDIW